MNQALTNTNNLQQMRALFNSLPNMIALIDASMRYRLINRAYTDYFGNTEQELKGKYASEVLGSSYARMVEKYLAHAFKGKSTTWVISHNSYMVGERLLSIKLLPYPDSSNAIRNVLFIAEDITETVQLHQKLAAFKEANEHKIMKSSEELDNTLRSIEYHAFKLDDASNTGKTLQTSIKRKVFATRIKNQLTHMQDDGGHKAYLIFTIKNYAAIVRVYGAAASKAVLNHFADRLDTLLDESVEIGQIDQERIAIGIPGISLETAQSFGQVICNEMKNCEIKHEGISIHYSVYSGATACRPTDANISDIKNLVM